MYNGYQDLYPKANKLMKRFSQISVRESDGVNICNREFDIDATQVLDPVFLLDAEDYIKMMTDIKYQPQKPYMVSYFLKYQSGMNTLLEHVSKTLDLDMINMGSGNKTVFEEQKSKTIVSA